TLLFVLLLGLVLMADLAGFSMGALATNQEIWIRLVPVVFFLLAFGRLYYRHSLVGRCLSKLEELLGDKMKARHLLYRLRDQEIKEFANTTPDQIRKFIDQTSQQSFRWRFLTKLYPTRSQ
ncbi:MAG: hypothetical protein K2X39_10365, partial [Silvanigrellaceae bacterium]|nr:hypothetical protein [Silvanigrellaceae bacterium]